MFAVLSFVLAVLAVPFKSKRRLEAENAALRHQVMVLRRQVRGRIHFTNFDRLFLVQLYRWCPSILRALVIIEPETLVRWTAIFSAQSPTTCPCRKPIRLAVDRESGNPVVG